MAQRQPAHQPTVQDVARLAGVAKATAARALGGYGAVSPAVLRRVTEAAQQLGYRPNELARSMTTGRTNTIGVVVGDIENPFFGLAVRGITDTARTEGFDVILANTSEDVNFEQSAVRLLLDRRVDGLIVSAAHSAEFAHLSEALGLGTPVVLLDRRVDGLDLDAVTVDNTAAAAAAARHLIAAGHRRIAFISSATPPGDPAGSAPVPGVELDPATIPTSTVVDRITGLLHVAAEAGLDRPERYLRLGARGPAACRGIVAELMALPEPPTAIIASDSMVALGVFQALRGLSIPVPQDISLVTFDDSDWTRITTPPLTVIAQPIYDLGAEASRILIRRITGDQAPRTNRVFTAELIRRGSVAAPAAS